MDFGSPAPSSGFRRRGGARLGRDHVALYAAEPPGRAGPAAPGGPVPRARRVAWRPKRDGWTVGRLESWVWLGVCDCDISCFFFGASRIENDRDIELDLNGIPSTMINGYFMGI